MAIRDLTFSIDAPGTDKTVMALVVYKGPDGTMGKTFLGDGAGGGVQTTITFQKDPGTGVYAADTNIGSSGLVAVADAAYDEYGQAYDHFASKDDWEVVLVGARRARYLYSSGTLRVDLSDLENKEYKPGDYAKIVADTSDYFGAIACFGMEQLFATTRDARSLRSDKSLRGPFLDPQDTVTDVRKTYVRTPSQGFIASIPTAIVGNAGGNAAATIKVYSCSQTADGDALTLKTLADDTNGPVTADLIGNPIRSKLGERLILEVVEANAIDALQVTALGGVATGSDMRDSTFI